VATASSSGAGLKGPTLHAAELESEAWPGPGWTPGPTFSVSFFFDNTFSVS